MRLLGARALNVRHILLPLPPTAHPSSRLQAYLAEQGYFDSGEGLSGYFGAMTGEALQAWQRDQARSRESQRRLQGMHTMVMHRLASCWTACIPDQLGC